MRPQEPRLRQERSSFLRRESGNIAARATAFSEHDRKASGNRNGRSFGLSALRADTAGREAASL